MPEIYTGIIPDGVEAERWRDALRTTLLPEYKCANTLQLQKKLFDFGHQMGIMISMNILTQNIENYKWPENWIEAVKERWVPNVFRKYWPVKYTKIEVKAIYPNAKLLDPIFKVVSQGDHNA